MAYDNKFSVHPTLLERKEAVLLELHEAVRQRSESDPELQIGDDDSEEANDSEDNDSEDDDYLWPSIFYI